ncbi:MAG TPA: TOMM precursor leader peptide-binding protein, partial [Solirubrobacteraceae bacterium]|nr:TOMM precursor leader peptide-binding protein [Solirubrobacteraceae bacterium]
IVGCGALGSWTAAGLACAGVGRLVLVDDDTVELSNLNRQLLFRRSDVGRLKVEAAADALLGFDPGIEVVGFARRVRGEADVEEVAGEADLIVATADDPPYAMERWVNAVALRRGIPHVSASQFPPYVRVGPLIRPGITGCVNCQHVEGRRTYPDFDALIRYRETHRRSATALGPLAALVGSVLSADTVHLLTGLATPATSGTAIVIDSRDLSMDKERVERDPDCELCARLGATPPMALPGAAAGR